jgi:KUP system potassium uptake protein
MRVSSTSDTTTANAHASAPTGRRLAWLTLGALGIVFGDLGTSPLYALQECFGGAYPIAVTPDNVRGAVSLFVWSLIIVVSVKYVVIIMRADNQGEGGILALLAMALNGGVSRRTEPDVTPVRAMRHRMAIVLTLGFLGAALLYGDGVITPAISVLSAVEGLDVATPVFRPFIVPIAVVILLALFSLQRFGSGRVGAVFGVVLATWFVTIAVLGAWNLATHGTTVATALDPRWCVRFFREHGLRGVPVLGAVVLCLTGVEALYADMGHFGRRPIRVAWYTLALPALVLSYLGQGALLLEQPTAASRPFFNSVPAWGLYPMVVLATAATVVASQALIAAVFSMTSQAAQLGYLPRLRVAHTSARQIGQVYLPGLNWMLMIACVAVTIGFRTSSALAAAFGLAVSGTMTITTILFGIVAHRRWNWPLPLVVAVAGLLLVIDTAFLSANLLKIAAGGWFPLALAAIVFTLMTTWTRGRALLRAEYQARAMPATEFVASIAGNPPPRVRGVAVFMRATSTDVPVALLHNLKHNRILHDTTVMLTVRTERVPRVLPADRLVVASLGQGFWSVEGRYGYMDQPNVPDLLVQAGTHGLHVSPADASYYLSRETIVPSQRPGMALWRERLFGFMVRNAKPASAFFGLKPNRVVELGAQIEI